MNWLDIVIIIAIVLSAISGLARGFIRTAASLIGLVLGVIVAGRFYTDFAGVFSFINNDNAANIVAFIVIFLAVSIIVSLLGILLARLFHATLLGWLDHLLGGAVGIIVGGLFIAAILAVWVKYMGTAGVIADSSIAQFLLDSFPFILGLLPAEFDEVRNFFES